MQAITKLGRTTIYELMRTGEVPFLRIGRSVRFRREALDTWLKAQEVPHHVVNARW
ncbi:MAG: helix-turn-helix domain-containing protein [Ardenticatenia bacterium]|nr:helix-turn-helix domain-containing protein [Ardenticatenia bacterium]